MSTPYLGVQQINGTMFHCTGHKWSPEIQDGSLQTGSTYISACKPGRNAISRPITPIVGVQQLKDTMVHST